MNYYHETQLVRRFVANQTGDLEWDDFISIVTDDDSLNAFKNYCSDMQLLYPAASAYCSEQGFEKLLEAADSLAQGGDDFLQWLRRQEA